MIEVALADARVVFTDRADGDVREPASLARLAARTGRTIAQGRQVHGAFVRRVDAAAPSADVEADGQATARTDVAVLVRAADCLPVALAGGGVVAMVHAGWRGLAAGVLEEGVASLLALGATDPLHAAIGPGAGPLLLRGRRRRPRGVRGHRAHARHQGHRARAARRRRGRLRRGRRRVHDLRRGPLQLPPRGRGRRASGGYGMASLGHRRPATQPRRGARRGRRGGQRPRRAGPRCRQVRRRGGRRGARAGGG